MNNQQKNGAADPAKLAELLAFEEEAKRGDAEAQYRVATIYHAGKAVPQDYARAAELCRMAAEQGHAEALRLLGQMHMSGSGVPQDKAKSPFWLYM
ncbi:MAG: hypothetical protein LBC63_09635 [Holophagales bacterium]|jgi:TPR repeat protein|nr:hypothetical protein [Holophagales bacterium]